MQTTIVNKKLFNRSVQYKPDSFVQHLTEPFTELIWRPDYLLPMSDVKFVSCCICIRPGILVLFGPVQDLIFFFPSLI